MRSLRGASTTVDAAVIWFGMFQVTWPFTFLDRCSTREFVYAPILPGFAVNTLFYAGVLWLLFAGPFALRRTLRKRRGHCAACAYPNGTNERCTECGAAVIPAQAGIQ